MTVHHLPVFQVSYQFRVSAVNGVGEGAAGTPTEPVSVPPEPPGGPPQGVVGASPSPTSVMLQWQPPLEGERNGRLLGYAVEYRLAGYPSSPWAGVNVTATRATLEDLIVWQTYALRVAAFNEKGLGVFSEPIHVRTREGGGWRRGPGGTGNFEGLLCHCFVWQGFPPGATP